MSSLHTLLSPHWCTLWAVLLRVITSTSNSIGSLFFFAYPTASPYCQVWTLSQHVLFGIKIGILKDSTICWFLLFSCLSPILTILIVYRPVLILILIILVRLCVCFLLMWSVFPFLAFCLLISNLIYFFDCHTGWQRNLNLREIITSYFNSLTSYLFYFPYAPHPYMTSSENRVKAYENILLQSAPDLESMLF